MQTPALPQSVQEIAEVIGRENALLLIGRLPTIYAGTPGKKSNRVVLYVPKRLPPDHRLVQILGWHPALKLVKYFGGELMFPANCRHLYSRFRDKIIVEMLSAGAKPDDVARDMCVSTKLVMVAKLKAKKEAENA